MTDITTQIIKLNEVNEDLNVALRSKERQITRLYSELKEMNDRLFLKQCESAKEISSLNTFFVTDINDDRYRYPDFQSFRNEAEGFGWTEADILSITQGKSVNVERAMKYFEYPDDDDGAEMNADQRAER